MTASVKEYFDSIKNKKIAFLGVGVSHTDLIKKFAALGADITLCDMRSKEAMGDDIKGFDELGIKYQLEEHQFDNLERFDMVFRTPGIYFNKPEIQNAIKNGANITSEMEEFFKICPCKKIAVTGADGKTTTTTIISELLAAQGFTVHKGGNIGRALLPIADKIDENDFAVVELSSFQLISMKYGPDIAVVTNVQPNHLNVHKDYQEYKDSKKNMIIYQPSASKTILNYDNDVTRDEYAPFVKGKTIWFSRRTEPENGAFWDMSTGEIYYKDNGEKIHVMYRSDIALVGNHNVENYLAAISATRGLVDISTIKKVAAAFTGVEHRMELVREFNGVKYYNDSIASSPDRTIAGLMAYDKKIILIAGGQNKGLVYDKLGRAINDKVKVLICMGETGPIIEECTKKADNYNPAGIKIFNAVYMEQAVDIAKENATSGDVVALSPASTSFDRYRNFEYRGRIFKEIVRGTK